MAANKDFDLLIIPNRNHDSLYVDPYFIRRQWDYFVRHLLAVEPPADYRIGEAGKGDGLLDTPQPDGGL